MPHVALSAVCHKAAGDSDTYADLQSSQFLANDINDRHVSGMITILYLSQTLKMTIKKKCESQTEIDIGK